MKKIKWNLLILCIVFTELVGIASSLLSGNIKESYAALQQPPLSPPGWLFGIVWPLLYALMGIALYLILNGNHSRQEKNTAFGFYLAQLAVNFIWPIIFFRFDAYWAAFIIICILAVLIALTMLIFSKLNKTSAILFIPYLLWILFATYLNIGTALLN